MFLSIEFGSLLVKIGQFILSFSILVVLHELGHFIPARIFKCRVEKFFLFFDAGFSLFKKKIGETEYGIGWIPFGGYVKISGMIDESMDKAQLSLPAQPYEFRSKPAWQRLIIMIGGVIVNVILAIVIFIGITWVWGDEYLPSKNLKFGLYAYDMAKNIGIKNHDNIIAIDGKKIDNTYTIDAEIVLNDAKKITVARDNKTLEIAIPDGFVKELNKSKLTGFVDPFFPTVVDSVLKKEAVFTKGQLEKGDTIVAINNIYLESYQDFITTRNKFKDSLVTLTVKRASQTASIRCLLKNGKVGFNALSPEKMFGTTKQSYDFLAAIPKGTSRCYETLTKYLTGIKQLFTGKANPNDSVGGIISIGNTFPSEWDWQRFWTLTGIFSIVLAFMNILPIPALDGGHALFTIIEIITRRKPSDKFMEYAQTVGMVLVVGLMVYGLGLDFWRLFK